MKKITLTLLALHLALIPVYADVIPSRRIERDAAAEQKVKGRLHELGLNASQAEHEVLALNPAETAYFAENPQRLQPVGGLYWYEFLIGTGVLVLAVVVWYAVWGTD